MTDMEKAYAFELQRRQTIGNYLARVNNLGYGNAVGIGLLKSTDEQDAEMENQAKDLESGTKGSEDDGGQKMSMSLGEKDEDPKEEFPVGDFSDDGLF